MSTFKYPENQHLADTIREHGLQLTLLREETPGVDDCRLIRIQAPTWHVEMPVEDEYGDALLPNNPLALLHVVLLGADILEDARDFRDWLRLNAYPEESPELKAVYEAQVKAVQIIRQQLPDATPINTFDYQLGANASRELRAYTEGSGKRSV